MIDIRPLCRDHHDRDVELAPKLSTDLKTVHPRQHDIQKNQIILARERFRQPLCPIDFHRHLIPADFQIILLDGSNVFIIFYDQYTFHDFSSFGKEICTKSPCGVRLSIDSVPCMSITARFTMASPSPLPLSVWLLARSVR